MSKQAAVFAPVEPARVRAQLWCAEGFRADPWRLLTGDEMLPYDGRVIISPTRWRGGGQSFAVSGLSVGIRLGAGEFAFLTARDAQRLELIALEFPKFTDGRAYSTARRLREQWGFTGELRAVGDVLLDQIPLMLRCGFDSFEITDAATIRALQAAPPPALLRCYQAVPHARGGGWRSRRSTLPGLAAAE